MQEKLTAILLFSRNAHEEFRHKSWGLNYSRFSKVYRTLINRVRQTAAASGLPFYEADSSVQQGSDFGTRLIHSVKWVRSKGYDRVIILGNDSPELNHRQIRSAAIALEEGRPALGKDRHGGAYLIGIDITQTDLTALKSIDWHTSGVFEQLKGLLGQPFLLKEQLTDLNQATDFQTISSSHGLSKRLIKVLWDLVFGLVRFHSFILINLPFTVKHEYRHRGPPALA